MLSEIQDVHIEQTADRVKIVLPTQRQPLWLLVYTILIFVWSAGLIWGIIFTIRDIAFSGERFALVFTIMLLVWLYIWYRLGRIIWHQWQYYAARREILFVESQRFMIRRPVSILGITDAYDMDHVSQFRFSVDKSCAGFNYGNRRIYFACGLDEDAARQLTHALNDLCFDYDDDDYD